MTCAFCFPSGSPMTVWLTSSPTVHRVSWAHADATVAWTLTFSRAASTTTLHNKEGVLLCRRSLAHGRASVDAPCWQTLER